MALLYVMCSCVSVTLPYSVLGQVWYLIVSIPDLPYFQYSVTLISEIYFQVNKRHHGFDFKGEPWFQVFILVTVPYLG